MASYISPVSPSLLCVQGSSWCMLLRSVQSGCRSFHWASCYHCRWCFRWCRQRDRHLRSKRSASFSSRQVRIPRRALQRPQEIDIPTPGLFASANSPCLVQSTLGHHQHLITAVSDPNERCVLQSGIRFRPSGHFQVQSAWNELVLRILPAVGDAALPA